jgi:hypothetical protein
MPYAFNIAGVLGGTCAVVVFSGCSAYTAHLMAWTLGSRKPQVANDAGSEHGGWPCLVEAAFGSRAKQMITAFLLVELWGYLLSTIISAAMNLHQFAQNISVPYAIFGAVAAAYFLTSLPSRELTRLNVTANMCYLGCCLMFLATGFFLAVTSADTKPANNMELFRPSGFLSAAGMIVFSPAAHSFYPQVMQRLEEPRKFTACVRRAYAAACVVYLTVAVLGCLTFGAAVQPSAVANIGVDLHLMPIPGLAWMNSVAAFCMVVKTFAMQPLILVPLRMTVESAIEDWCPKVLAHKFQSHVLVVILAISALASHHFAEEIVVVLNFMGCVFCMTIAFIVPVLCYWKLAEDPVGPWQKLSFVGLLAMGGTFVAGGLVGAF